MSAVALAVSALPLGRRATKAAGGAEACTAGTAVAMEREHLLCKLIFHISDVWGRHRSSASAPPRASHSRISNATCDVSHARVGLPIDAYLARPAQYHSAAVQQPHTHLTTARAKASRTTSPLVVYGTLPTAGHSALRAIHRLTSLAPLVWYSASTRPTPTPGSRRA